MSIIGSNILAGASGQDGAYEIDRSLRFNDGDTAYLSRTLSSDGNRKTFTWSGWVKRSTPSSSSLETMFSSTTEVASGNSNTYLTFYQDKIYINSYDYPSGSAYTLTTTQVFRDPSAWYHIVWAVDTTQATSSNRIKLYVNGEQVTSFSTETYPSQNYQGLINSSSYKMTMGGSFPLSINNIFDGYMTEVNFVDGTALDYTSFGETDTDTGAWIPKKYSGTYGTNGFYLNFSDNSGVTATTLGKDSSGNGNNWTPNNFSVTAGAGNDSLEDTPTNNHATFNAIDHQEGSSTFSEGNLKVTTTSSGTGRAISTIRPTSGKWYCEFTVDDATRFSVGVENGDRESSTQGGNSTNSVIVFYTKAAYFNSTSTNNYLDANISNDNTIQVALDLDNNAVYVGRNNTWGNSATASEIASGTTTNSLSAFVGSTNMLTGDVGVFVEDNSGSGTMGATANFGQRAFTYTPPTGFKALNTANLPVPTVKNGTEYMQTVLYTGNAAVRNITVADSQDAVWQPDWVWIKGRGTTSAHTTYDSVRGATKYLRPDTDAPETTDTDTLTAFNSNGFSLGADVKVNTNNYTYVSWNWKAGGTTTTPTQGTIASTASVNAEAGFSIVSYTSNGTSGATVGHGLGVAPGMILVKMRTSQSVGTDNWAVFHKSLGATKNLWLDVGNGENISSAYWNNTEPTSSVFSLGNDLDVNHSNGYDYIALVFSEVEGYSKFGSYTGNGGQPDGTFVYTGFKPAWLMIKKSSAGDAWLIIDNKRDTFNFRDTFLKAEDGINEGNYNITGGLDFLSNGFKLRDNDGGVNGTSATYIYMAFAETPFKHATAS